MQRGGRFHEMDAAGNQVVVGRFVAGNNSGTVGADAV